VSFRIVRLPKFGNFLEKNPFFSEFTKILLKKFGNKFGSKKPVCGSINPVFGSKNSIFEAKIGVLGSKTGVLEHFNLTEYSEFVLFQIFQKLQKNNVKIEFLFSQKTCSDSNSDSNIQVRVRYAGPYLHFTNRFFANFLLPKNYKAKL